MKIRRLFNNVPDISAIMEVEQRSLIPPIRTTETNIRRRLSMNHFYFGAFDGTRPIGTIAFLCTHFSPQDYEHFPKTFKENVEKPNEPEANAAFIHSVRVVPEYRTGMVTKKLIQSAHLEAKHLGLCYGVGDSRCPSYNGSTLYPEEHFEQNEEVHRAIKQHLNGGPFPKNEILVKDPVLGFYIRAFGVKPLWIIPGFWPGDEPSGNLVVILYKPL